MANHGHKRDTNARSKPRLVTIAASVSTLATLAVVGVGVLGSDPEIKEVVSANQASIGGAAPERKQEVSRSSGRASLDLDQLSASATYSRSANRLATQRAVKSADSKLWTTEELNLWDAPTDGATQVGSIDAGKQVLVTGREQNGRTEIVVGGRSRWVTADYLDDEKPVEGIGGECTNGTSVPSGVSPNIVKVHAAVCAAFPDITTYGTFRGDGEHSQGLAVDIMVSGDRGYQVRDFVREHYAELGVNYIIYSQQIWSVDRSGEGWRGMEDRGSTTANHYDHVHVTTY
ncbi:MULTISPECIES: hypothetical protein [unclassified Nocardioides]|uniref:hypothetical protein n=1 Tax=unclassified Nocardioides TaxID=2615069 RepID=UPI00071345EA|nr:MULTISPECIES: hypothetical protein [unclassified Nocardioides]KQY61798.1 hypothetical protein ASD30_25460 [Nocardioides sp. Root140]